jgi:hypothetical protein
VLALNQLQAVQSSLPPELSKLARLTVFRVERLRLIGSIPPEYAALTNVRKFTIGSRTVPGDGDTDVNDDDDNDDDDDGGGSVGGGGAFGLTGPIPGSLTALQTSLTAPDTSGDVNDRSFWLGYRGDADGDYGADKLCVDDDNDHDNDKGDSAAVVDMMTRAGNETYPLCSGGTPSTPALPPKRDSTGEDSGVDSGGGGATTGGAGDPNAADGAAATAAADDDDGMIGLAIVIGVTVAGVAIFVVAALVVKVRRATKKKITAQFNRKQSVAMRRRSVSMKTLEKNDGGVEIVDVVGNVQLL